MSQAVRFIIINSDEAFAAELRASLTGIEGAKIVAEVEDFAIASQAVQRCPADAVLVNLDPAPEAVLPIAGEIARAMPELAVFAVSGSTDGQLILKAMRMGLREYLPTPIDPKALAEAVERIAAQRGSVAPHGRLITVIGSTGGVGATTIATNLAVELAQIAQGGVTLVDLDYRFGQVATFLDVDPQYTLADLCNSPERLEQQVIDRALVKHSSGLRILSRPAHIAQADTLTAAACVGLLSTLLQFNEYVVADGPTRFDVGGRAVLDLCDINLLVVQLLIPSVRNGVRMIEGFRESGFGLGRTRAVYNRAGRDSGNLLMEDVAATLGLEALPAIPDDWQAVSGAINLGEPLLTHSPRSRARQALLEIAQRLHTPDAVSDEKGAPKKGIIGRMFAGA